MARLKLSENSFGAGRPSVTSCNLRLRQAALGRAALGLALGQAALGWAALG